MASILTPTGTVSFPQLFVARPAQPGGQPRFSLSLIFPPEAQRTPEFDALKKLVVETLDAKWPGKSKEAGVWSRYRHPIRKAEEKEYAGYDVPGAYFIAPWTKNKPGLIDARKQPILVPDDVWAGQLSRATVHAFAYDNSGNKGVGLMLNNVQIVKADMPRLDGRKEADKEFGEVDDGAAGGGANITDDDAPF